MSARTNSDNKEHVAVIGLGYVGLPLALLIAKSFDVVGYDISESRIQELQNGIDTTGEIADGEFEFANSLTLTNDVSKLAACTFYIITVPTPVTNSNSPDLSHLISASEMVAKYLKPNDVVVFESTVFPGATEDICGPILAKISGLKVATDSVAESTFHLGYSPERINPGDKSRRLEDIIKVTSASSKIGSQRVADLYGRLITKDIYVAPTIRIAEAAKVIENIQRDVNIALINELAMLFEKLELDTQSVLACAKTKWNFLDFKPGLVGGHCIGVDPYYLTHKAAEVNFHSEMVLAGRRVNEGMSGYLAQRIIRLMVKHDITISKSKVLILGLTFKEDCPDLRNSKVFDVIDDITSFGCIAHACDPYVENKSVAPSSNFTMVSKPKRNFYDAIVLAVPHSEFIEMGPVGCRSYGKKGSVLFDVKSVFKIEDADGRL